MEPDGEEQVWQGERAFKYHMVRRSWLCLHLGLTLTEVLV